MASSFLRYLASILLRYSGLISMAAKLNAEFFRPARWHSMTADVRMGTMSGGGSQDVCQHSAALYSGRTPTCVTKRYPTIPVHPLRYDVLQGLRLHCVVSLNLGQFNGRFIFLTLHICLCWRLLLDRLSKADKNSAKQRETGKVGQGFKPTLCIKTHFLKGSST